MRNDIQSSLSAPGISHSLYLYLHIFIWILFFPQHGKHAWWMCGRGPTGTRGSLQDWSVVRQRPASPWSLEIIGLCSLFIIPTCCTDKEFLFREMQGWQYCTTVGEREYVGECVGKCTGKYHLCQDFTQKGCIRFSLSCQFEVYLQKK